jgi:hypothetical protein
MKKLLIAVMMGVAFTGNANAFEFDMNSKVMTQIAIVSIAKQILGNEININTGVGGVEVHTGRGIATGKMQKCWVSPQYHSDGSVTNRVVCM